ncbi:MAG: hypothetical protein U0800_00460 [Isosphaeraceae bacterium]
MIIAAIVLGSLSSMAGWSAIKKPDVVEARRFNVRDSDGEIRASLYYDAGTDPQEAILALFDQAGNSRIILSVNQQDMPSFYMYDKENDLRLATALEADGSPVQIFFPEPGSVEPRPALSVGRHIGGESLGLHWLRDDKIRCFLGMNGKADAVMEMFDSQGTSRISLASTDDGQHRGLSVRNDADEYCLFGQLGDGSVGVEASDHLQQARLLLYKSLGGNPALAFIDRDGQPILLLPGDLPSDEDP